MESIQDSAFRESGIQKLKLPDSLLSLDNLAFFGCDKLEAVIIPDLVAYVGSQTFDACNKMKSIHIGASVEKFNSILRCDSLEIITVDERNLTYHATNNCLIETQSKKLVRGCKTSVIPNDGSVTTIGRLAFDGCYNLIDLVIPDSVILIEESAFLECRSLKKIVIPDTTTLASIYNGIFHYCVKLKEVTLGRQITFVSSTMFYECTSLTTVNLTNSVTRIGRQAFYACESLTDLNFAGTMEEWNRIEKEDGWDVGTGNYTVHCTDGDITKA